MISVNGSGHAWNTTSYAKIARNIISKQLDALHEERTRKAGFSCHTQKITLLYNRRVVRSQTPQQIRIYFEISKEN